jgi:UDP-N-acetylmuramate--alanine ligase
MIICMGAGDITKWAAALADGIGTARASKSPLPKAGGD